MNLQLQLLLLLQLQLLSITITINYNWLYRKQKLSKKITFQQPLHLTYIWMRLE